MISSAENWSSVPFEARDARPQCHMAFRGPGLAIRIPGEVTRDKPENLRKADAGLSKRSATPAFLRGDLQAFAVLLPVRSVGVKGGCANLRFQMCFARDDVG